MIALVHPDFQQKARRALAHLGGSLPKSAHSAHVARTAGKPKQRLNAQAVSMTGNDCGEKFSPQGPKGAKTHPARKAKKSGKSMVGAAGIGAATPTMSSKGAGKAKHQEIKLKIPLCYRMADSHRRNLTAGKKQNSPSDGFDE